MAPRCRGPDHDRAAPPSGAATVRKSLIFATVFRLITCAGRSAGALGGPVCSGGSRTSVVSVARRGAGGRRAEGGVGGMPGLLVALPLRAGGGGPMMGASRVEIPFGA